MVFRVLGPADVPVLEAFLERHADSSLFLRSNLRSAGIVDRGEPFQATYRSRGDATVSRSWPAPPGCRGQQSRRGGRGTHDERTRLGATARRRAIATAFHAGAAQSAISVKGRSPCVFRFADA